MLNMSTKRFLEVFVEKEEGTIFSPGRINLIGEHIDYNGGNVFPVAIDYGTYVVFSRREDNEIHLFSENFSEDGVIVTKLDTLEKLGDKWANFPIGMIVTFALHGHLLPTGFNAYVFGNIPVGAGLSSSASLEMAFAVLLNFLGAFGLEMSELINYAQETERDFIGVNVGVMDMYAIGMGLENHAMLLDTKTADLTYVPVDLKGKKLLIMNTNKPRALVSSKYNERRAECDQALLAIKQSFDIDFLCDVSLTDLSQVEQLLADDVLYRRVRHVVTEQERTVKAKQYLVEGDIVNLATLLNESHLSLQLDYEVTGAELDSIVTVARSFPATLGARMTGAGFGGCAIAIIDGEEVNAFIAYVTKKYEQETGLKPAFYEVNIVDGTSFV